MKKEFVKSWNKSVQPRKQRKFRYNAPLHIKKKFLAANLTKELRKKYGKRSVIIKKGDKVKVLRGQHKGKTGKVDIVSVKKCKVYISGIDLIRKDGTKSLIPFEPSNLQIIELDMSGKNRFSSTNSKQNNKQK